MTAARRRPPDYAAAFKLLTRAHRAGDARATYALGTWYLHGRLVRKDIQKGLKLIEKAAGQNVADALYDIAFSFESGKGRPKSLEKAAENYLRAALLGNTRALHEFGRCIYYGIGLPSNRRVAHVFLDVWHLLRKTSPKNKGPRPIKRTASKLTASISAPIAPGRAR